MPHFQFSLHRLLDLRQLELRQLEMRASLEAQQAAAARRQAERLLEQLATTATDTAGGDWLILQQGAHTLRQQAVAAKAVAEAHQQNHQALLAACAEQRIKVEALESLRDTEHQEFLRRQNRRDEAAMQEQILRKWQSQQRQKSLSNHSTPSHQGGDHLGRLSHG